MKSTINKHRKTTFLFLSALLIGLIVASCALPKKESKSPDNLPVTVLQLTPSDDNPRNSEGDFITLDDGRILFIYSHYTGSSTSDHAPAYLAARYSDDGGRSWTDKDEVVVENEGEMNVMSVSLLRLQNGDIAFFYLRKNSTEDCIPMLRISKDEAKSWSDPVPCITDRQGYFVLNNARVIQLQDGRLLMPVALHQTPGGQWANKADLYCYFSDDNGQTWQSSSQVPDSTDIVTQEPGLIEMNDGSVMMYIRTNGDFSCYLIHLMEGKRGVTLKPATYPPLYLPLPLKRFPLQAIGCWCGTTTTVQAPRSRIKGHRSPWPFPGMRGRHGRRSRTFTMIRTVGIATLLFSSWATTLCWAIVPGANRETPIFPSRI